MPILEHNPRLAGKNTRFNLEVNRVQTLLFCKGWKQHQIDWLLVQAQQRYGRDKRFLLLVLKKSYDYTVDGKQPSEIIRMFAPDSKRGNMP